MQRHINRWHVVGGIVVVLLITLGALYLAPSNDYILLPVSYTHLTLPTTPYV